MCEAIRELLSLKDLKQADYDNVANETDIFTSMTSIFALEDNGMDDLTCHLKEKALNICVNMAMGSAETIQEMLQPKYGVLAQVNRVLDQAQTYELLENTLWLLANVSGDDIYFCKVILKETNLINFLDQYTQTDAIFQLNHTMADMFTWLLDNI